MKGKDREPTLRYLTLYDRRHHPRPTWTDWQVDGARRQMVDDAPNNTALLVPPLRLGRHNRAKCNRGKRKELASENTHKVPTHTHSHCACVLLFDCHCRASNFGEIKTMAMSLVGRRTATTTTTTIKGYSENQTNRETETVVVSTTNWKQ